MTVVVDSSVIIDVLKGNDSAVGVLRVARSAGPLHASEISRLEILAGMRANEERVTRGLLEVFTWHPVDGEIAELAGELGRRWLPGNRGVDGPDLAIAATAIALEADLLTRNVSHFPMFDRLTPPY